MAATAKRKLARENKDLENQLNLFTDAPPDQDEGGTESSDDDVIFENSAGMDDDSSSEEESLPSGLSDLSDNDDIGDIITLKDDSDSEDDGSIGDDEDGDDENNGVSDEEVEDEPNTVKDSKKAERKGKLAAAGKKDKSEREENAKTEETKTMKKREWKEREQNRKKREKELNMLNEKKKALEEERKISESKEGGQGGPSGGTSSEKPADEYEYDSSDEEDIRNTVGNVPMEWYRGFDHIGYNVRGEKIIKPPTRDELDEFLSKVDNPDYWRTVFDKKNGEDIVLTDDDLDVIQRIQRGRYPEPSVEAYPDYIDFFTYEKMIHPLTRRPEHKRSFIPSMSDKAKVSRYLIAMKRGLMKPSWEQDEGKKGDEIGVFYDIWSSDANAPVTKRPMSHIAAPKVKWPGHAQSYRPPPEYLLSEEENQLEAEDLLPKLPKPKDLQPFPTTLALLYAGHTSYVRSISVDPSGQWLASDYSNYLLYTDTYTVLFQSRLVNCSNLNEHCGGIVITTMRLSKYISVPIDNPILTSVATGRCLQIVEVDGPVECVAWSPNPIISLVVFSVGEKIHVFNPKLGDKLIVSGTDQLLEDYKKPEEVKTSPLVEWEASEGDSFEQGFRLTLKHFKPVRQISWHGKGDYFAVVIPTGQRSSVMIHQLSKRRSQNPFRKSKGLVQCTAFHPTRPFFFVATQRHVRIYNLIKQEMTKKLLTNAKWVSSIAVHPGGDNVIIGTYDCKLSWFDLDLSVSPYKTLRHHKQAIRSVAYHKRYPLFASASDDGHVIICHGQVYNDLLQNPLIVPVKVLKGHAITNGLGVLCCEFHPSQPWIFSSAADGMIGSSPSVSKSYE
ncbi:putative ribosome biogenesis protein bop1-B [Apostichopus japonicus]|uniref:Ribosome biogenesis protein BOP1 homolog n=1 Tax=Stichopus japonicus TaxID=307972 RepID=A0A2G8JIX8_STIJA|nr:putative ribosome biogenesis protein bop1-B [Apostichopus japonicus]